MEKEMKLNDAILKSLDEINTASTSIGVYNHIVTNNYFPFKTRKQGDKGTPENTVSSRLGDFVRKGDSRVKRIKENGTFLYYLAKNEQSHISNRTETPENKRNNNKLPSYSERDLHKPLSSFLNSVGIYSKTIFHEQSQSSKDSAQKWIHPDMVGVSFLNLKTKASQSFLKATNSIDTIKLYSYEIKKEINSDSELKKYFFQAVSNSSWANYSYLVAFEISGDLYQEMERLNQSFGIGIIELKSNPFESKIHYSAKYKEFDFKTIDKLCNINTDFEKFIEIVEKLMTAENKYAKSTEKELTDFCDKYFYSELEAEYYCKEKMIPIEDENEE